MITVSVAEMQKNFEYYLQAVQSGDEILILKNGEEIASLTSRKASRSPLTAALTGVLKHDCDDKAIRAERIEKHESTDRF